MKLWAYELRIPCTDFEHLGLLYKLSSEYCHYRVEYRVHVLYKQSCAYMSVPHTHFLHTIYTIQYPSINTNFHCKATWTTDVYVAIKFFIYLFIESFFDIESSTQRAGTRVLGALVSALLRITQSRCCRGPGPPIFTSFSQPAGSAWGGGCSRDTGTLTTLGPPGPGQGVLDPSTQPQITSHFEATYPHRTSIDIDEYRRVKAGWGHSDKAEIMGSYFAEKCSLETDFSDVATAFPDVKQRSLHRITTVHFRQSTVRRVLKGEVKAKIKISPVVVFGVLSRMVLVRES